MTPHTQARIVYFAIIPLLATALILNDVSVTLPNIISIAGGLALWAILRILYEYQLNRRELVNLSADAQKKLDAGG